MISEIADLADSTIRIIEPGFGSGVVVGHQGKHSYALTCAHVVGEATQVLLDLRPQRQIAKVLFIDKEKDLAFIRTKKLSMRAVEVAADGPNCYSRIYGAGYLPEFDLMAFEGVLSSVDCGGGYLFTGVVAAGMSGGPLINYEGRLVGIIDGVARSDHMLLFNVGCAVSHADLVSFCMACFDKSQRKKH